MFDHIGITVRDLTASRAFYTAALAPLGIKPVSEFPGWVGFGERAPKFWIAEGAATAARPRVHVAFAASRSLVDKFYAAAMNAGALDNGRPGPRPHYHEHYYGAFVIDPDGHNLEAVCHLPPSSSARATQRLPLAGIAAAALAKPTASLGARKAKPKAKASKGKPAKAKKARGRR